MTRQELEARYSLIRPLAGDGAGTFLARGGSGAIVMVHFLDAPIASWQGGRLTRLESLDPERRERITEVLDVDGRAVVVTRFLMDFRSFSDWLGVEEGGTAAADGAAADEFERLFGRAASPPADALEGGGRLAPEPSDVETPPTVEGFPALADPSGASQASHPEPAPPAAFTPPPVTPAPGAESTPPERAAPPEPEAPRGDATPPASPAPAESESAAAQAEAPAPGAEPGEFTRIFRAAHPPQPAPLEDYATFTPPASANPAAGAAETTTPVPGQDVAPPPPRDASEASADAPAVYPAGEAGAESAPPAAPQEPGEFTRIFRAAHTAEPAPLDDLAPPLNSDPVEVPSASTFDPDQSWPSRAAAPPPAAPVAGGGTVPAEESPPAVPPLPPEAHATAAKEGGAEAPQSGDLPTSAEVTPAAPPTSEPGEFTRMFRAARPPEPAPLDDFQPGPEADDVSRPSTPEPPLAGAPMTGASHPAAGGSSSATPPPQPTPPEALSPGPGGGSAAASASEPGEFTRMFRAAQLPHDAPPEPAREEPHPPELVDPPAPASTRPQPAPPPALEAPPTAETAAPGGAGATAPQSEPGEFTRMFRAAQPPAPREDTLLPPPAGREATQLPPPREASPPPPPVSSGPGEFTRTFRASQPAAPTGPGAPPPVAPPASAGADDSEPGEFTQMFQKLGSSSPPPPTASPAPPASAEPLWGSQDVSAEDRYRDRLFGGASPGARPPATPPAEPPRGEPPRVPVDPELPPLPSHMAPPPPPPPPMAGEYTRMIAAQRPPPEAAPPASGAAVPGVVAAAAAAPVAAATSAAKARAAPRLGPILGLTAVGFGAFALILYLVMKAGFTATSTEVPADSTAVPEAPAAPAASP